MHEKLLRLALAKRIIDGPANVENGRPRTSRLGGRETGLEEANQYVINWKGYKGQRSFESLIECFDLSPTLYMNHS